MFESPVLDEWPQHLNNLKIQHTKTKENMEFLGTIVEYLTVSEMDRHTLTLFICYSLVLEHTKSHRFQVRAISASKPNGRSSPYLDYVQSLLLRRAHARAVAQNIPCFRGKSKRNN